MLQNRLKYPKAYQFLDKNIIIEVQRELIERLKKDVGRLEAVVKKTKNPKKNSEKPQKKIGASRRKPQK